MQNLKLAIEGMHCGGCVNRVTMALKKAPGVEVRSVEVGSAEVSFDETRARPETIAEAVNKLGFVARIEA
jgi:copper chaperone/Cu+-exporting ATPase